MKTSMLLAPVLVTAALAAAVTMSGCGSSESTLSDSSDNSTPTVSEALAADVNVADSATPLSDASEPLASANELPEIRYFMLSYA